jgi:anthranilate synthase/aminodeoxychorismate synthase-like glutamine amidotransferase
MTYLIIDNYDSFVHNLARYFELADVDTLIKRNDEDISGVNLRAIVISPGPCTPSDAGICIDTIKQCGETTPILGVCLGHQAIGEAYGGKTIQAKPVHGMQSMITHDESPLFHDLPNPMPVGRYHSLVSDITDVPGLIPTAHCDDIIMAMQHRIHPVYGVQFHPESILTNDGLTLIKNFVRIVDEFHSA